MSILFDAETRIFHARTSRASYALQVLPSGHLAHLYWGAPLRESNVSHLLVMRDRAFSPSTDGKKNFSLDTLPQEFPAYGNSDFRSPAIEVQYCDGSTVCDLRYRSHRIFRGKPLLPGLPASYVESEEEADTLEIVLVDNLTGLEATLQLCAFEEIGVLSRSVRLHNGGSQVLEVGRCLSASVDFPTDDYDLLHLSGAWARERDVERRRLRPGTQSIESRRGASGHDHNPFLALLSPDATEDFGEAFAFSLVYSGSFVASAEVSQYSTTRAQIGINPFDFSWRLEAGESFQAPEAILAYSNRGLGELSRTLHRFFRTRVCRGPWRDRERPVLLNSWEAMYFDLSEEKILSLANAAQSVGIELLVVDDGWFGQRDDDTTSLGDWSVHKKKFPDGIGGVARRVNEMGLMFGLWFEPEMISRASDLYRAHPDWCLHVPDRARTEARQQLILDLSRTDVCEHIVESVGAILRENPIGYVKWDMNRNMTEIGSALLPPERQRETAHRYMIGLYGVLERLTQEFPEVLFEGCSGGGGRFDPGMLFTMPQVWASDNTDAIARLRIQYGTSIAYPASSVGAHVSASPNHQVGRSTPLSTRGAVAMGGSFGWELALDKLPADEMILVRRQVALYKELRPLVQTGEMFRLLSPFASPFEGIARVNEAAWMIVSADKSEAVVFFFQVLSEANAPTPLLKLRGLDANRDYHVREVGAHVAGEDEPIEELGHEVREADAVQETDLILGGDVLMSAGLRASGGHGDFGSHVWRIRAR